MLGAARSSPETAMQTTALVTGLATGLVLAALLHVAPAAAQGGSPRDGELRALAPGVWLLPGRFERGRQPDGNSLLLQGPEGWALVDSGRHAEHTQALIDHVRASGRPLVAVLNTHWHLDHLGGNAMLRDAAPGLRAWAAPAVRDAVRRRMPASAADLERMKADPQLDEATRRMVEIDLALYTRRAALEPDVLIEGPAQDLSLAGRPLRVGVAFGVSGGDLWLLDPASGTLVVGDFVTLPVPFFDTACPERWQRSLAQLAALPFERVVPGHGPVMERADFERYRSAYDRLLACAASARAVGECSAGWVTDLGPLLPASGERGAHGMLRHYLEQRLRADPARSAADCAAG
jgi:glyoxylase-like metal-dependent hydrolase (beta-lactamase superfamily II)